MQAVADSRERASRPPDAEVRGARRPESAGARRRADVQGLRAVAILLVVAFHAGLPLPGGYTGVDVFFVISGFVITATLLRELLSTGRVGLVAFWARRARRLLPALAVMIVAVSLLGVLAAPVAAQRTGALTAAFASVFGANGYLFSVRNGYFDPAATLNPFLHTWSLSVEEQFYLVFPFVLLGAWWVARRARRDGRTVAFLVVLLATELSYLVARGALPVPGLDPRDVGAHARFAFYASPARAWELGAGALAALAVPVVVRLPERAAVAVGLAGAAAIGAGAALLDRASLDSSASPFSTPLVALPVLGALAVVVAGTATSRGVSRVLSVRPAVWIGELSYSWYLWHWPLIVFAVALWPGAAWAAPVAAVLSLLPAWASYRWVETPARRGLGGRRLAVAAAGCLVVPAAVALLTVPVVRALDPPRWDAAAERHADVERGCDSLVPDLVSRGGDCTWVVPGSRGVVYLVGDSNAGHLTEPVVAAARADRLSTRVATFDLCPFALVSIDGGRGRERACLLFVERAVAELERLRPALVVVGVRSLGYVDGSGSFAVPGGKAVTERGPKLGLWSRGLETVMRRLAGAGVPVLLVHEPPVFPSWWSPGGCAVVRMLADGCNRSISRSAAEHARAGVLAAERAAIRAVPGAGGLDLYPVLCDTRRCPTVRHGVPLYRDATHLSVAGALTLEPLLARAIAALARR